MISKPLGRKKVKRPIRSYLAPLVQMGVTSEDWNAVRRYTKAHASVIPLLPDVCQRVRGEFGSQTELALDEYRDPEIDDRYLTLCLRLPNYELDTMDRIERVNQSFENRIKPNTGYLLVTTDFRRAKSHNGV
ncbi:MAG TPA: hypothetical protein VGX70_18025 [Gemmataceae bacterium]|jgi:hypothetical protein|nr:hypothetical protein [Gemmataceae bacterium]